MRYQTHKYNKSIINDVVQRKQQLIVAIMLIRLINCLVIKMKWWSEIKEVVVLKTI